MIVVAVFIGWWLGNSDKLILIQEIDVIPTFNFFDRPTDERTDRQTDRQTDRPTDRQTQ